LAKRLAALGFRFGPDQIGEPLDLGKVEAAMLEGAAGELTGLCGAQSRQPPQRHQSRCNDRPAAMQLQLRDVLAGFAMGRREPKRQGLVDWLARFGVSNGAKDGPARLGQPADHCFESESSRRARQADDRYGCRWRPGRQREDRIDSHEQ
jgi:hypothetical protein